MSLKRAFMWVCLGMATVVCISAWVYALMAGGGTLAVLVLYLLTIGLIMVWMQMGADE